MSSSSSLTRRLMASPGRLRILSPNATLSATVMFGKSAYDWKTIPTLRWFGGMCVTSRSSIVIVPAVGCSKPAIIRSVVVLPQPDGPRNDTNSPRAADRSKSRTATVPPAKRFWTPSSRRKLMPDSSLGSSQGDLAARPAAEQRDRDHRQPGQPEADQRHGGRFEGAVGAALLEVRSERRSGQVRGDRVFADDDGEAQERAGQDRDPQVREDDPDDDREPAAAEALGSLGERADVDRAQAG